MIITDRVIKTTAEIVFAVVMIGLNLLILRNEIELEASFAACEQYIDQINAAERHLN